MTDIAFSVNNVPVRLTAERWKHIVENHDDLAGYYDMVLKTVEDASYVMLLRAIKTPLSRWRK
jgi:hypothetical protein